QLIKPPPYPDLSTRVATYARDGSLLKVSGTAVHPVRYDFGVESDSGVQRVYTKEIKLDTNGNDTSEWTKTYTDMAGRVYKTAFAGASGTPASQSFYNSKGQLWKTVDPDSVTNLFAYNAKGELEFTAIDLNNDGQINTNGTDRVTRTVTDVVADHGTNVRRTQTYVWTTYGSADFVLASAIE